MLLISTHNTPLYSHTMHLLYFYGLIYWVPELLMDGVLS